LAIRAHLKQRLPHAIKDESSDSPSLNFSGRALLIDERCPLGRSSDKRSQSGPQAIGARPRQQPFDLLVRDRHPRLAAGLRQGVTSSAGRLV
jgi:hypothetical protein